MNLLVAGDLREDLKGTGFSQPPRLGSFRDRGGAKVRWEGWEGGGQQWPRHAEFAQGDPGNRDT